MHSIEIIDGQLHEPGLRRYWDSTDVATQHAALTDALHATLRAVGVAGAVLHPIEDASWAHGLAASDPDRFAVVRMVAAPAPALRRWDAIDPGAPDLEELLAEAAASPGFAGFRLGSFSEVDLPLGRGRRHDTVVRFCAERSIPVLSPFAGHPELAGAVARERPELPVVLDQLALGAVPGDHAEPWERLPTALALAELPNVHVKLTGLPSLSRVGFPFDDLRDRVREVLDRFGAARCFWASDISFYQGQVGWANRFPPLVGDYPGRHTYAESVAFVRDSSWLTDEEKRELLGGTVRQLFGWPGRTEG